MVRSKAPSKKQQKHGIDFKKIKRKIGRKLPPPKNATNTEIKSKTIVLPEQSVASEKAGLAVNKKGLTLKELLQQTSHYNSKVRKDALVGIRELVMKHASELRLHRIAIIEKLRERISDDDKVVRETLYQLLKSVIFPGCQEDNQGAFISLMMSYIFNAMTHLAIDVRLMAFKFFDLVLQYSPQCFSTYAEKILQNFEDILKKNQFLLQHKGELKNALSGLVRCLSLLCEEIEAYLRKKNTVGQRTLHAYAPDVPVHIAGFSLIKKVQDLVPVLVNCFQYFIHPVHSMPHLDVQSFDCMRCILQSITLAAKFSLHEIHKSKAQLLAPDGGFDVTLWKQTLSSVLLTKLFVVFPLSSVHHSSQKADDKYFVLNVAFTEIFLRCCDFICPPVVLWERFLEFVETALLGKMDGGSRSGRAAQDKHLLSLLPFIPKLASQVDSSWKFRILQAFTETFKSCDPQSSLKLACLLSVEDMLLAGKEVMYPVASDPALTDHQITWSRELPVLLIQLWDKKPSFSQVVLNIILRLGQCAPFKSSIASEYDNMQHSLLEFYSTTQEGKLCYGPFMRLDQDSQVLAVCSLYYFSSLDPLLLKSITSCCLCPELDPDMLMRIIGVLDSAYRAGHIPIAGQLSFFLTLISRFKVFPESIYSLAETHSGTSNRTTFRSVTRTVCSLVSQMGDNALIFQTLEKAILDQISLEPPSDNVCSMLQVLATLDCKPSVLSEQSIITLSNFLPRYLIDIVYCIPENDNDSAVSNYTQACRYYVVPCFFLFDRCHKLLKLVLDGMKSLISEYSQLLLAHNHAQNSTDCLGRINAIVSLLALMHRVVKMRKLILLFKSEIDQILEGISSLQSPEMVNLPIEEKHKMRCASERLEILTSAWS